MAGWLAGRPAGLPHDHSASQLASKFTVRFVINLFAARCQHFAFTLHMAWDWCMNLVTTFYGYEATIGGLSNGHLLSFSIYQVSTSVVFKE